MGWVVGIILAAAVLASINALVPLSRRWQTWDARRAIELFHRRREMLEAKFIDLARSLGKPRGLRWLDCEWSKEVTFARDRISGLLTAFVAVNIRFEAIEGGDMEDVAAVGTLRDAVAVFHFHQGVWGTGGKALFNMNPQSALEKLVAQFEPVVLLERPV